MCRTKKTERKQKIIIIKMSNYIQHIKYNI